MQSDVTTKVGDEADNNSHTGAQIIDATARATGGAGHDDAGGGVGVALGRNTPGPEKEGSRGTTAVSAPPAATSGNSPGRGSGSGRETDPGTLRASLLSLNDAVLVLTFAYLDAESVAACQETCRVVGSAAQSDDLWRAMCSHDWEEDRKVPPERRSGSGAVLLPTFLQTWRTWRKAFDGYDARDVKQVSAWWRGIEAWMSENLPEVLDSLNVGVSEEDLDAAEAQLKWPLPTHLRLLYRFHNGQWLPWDEALNLSVGADGGRPEVLPKINGSGMSLGLFGGYCFYRQMTTSKMFSLQRGVNAALVTNAAFDGENRGYFEACARQWGTSLETIQERGGFLLTGGDRMTKRAWIGRDGNVRFDGKSASIMGAFVAAPEPAHSPDAEESVNGDGGKGSRRKGNLMAWLHEYLRRLERGHYSVRSRWQESIQLQGEGVPRMRQLPGVWLFPRQGGEGCVTEVTRGVEIQVSPVFVPEECEGLEDNMWAYSVRMQLLHDHPSRPRTMSSCQLSTRHWEIDGPHGFHREISGQGVIGQQPVLNAVAPAVSENAPVAGNPVGAARAKEGVDEGVFEYESCTTLESTPALFTTPPLLPRILTGTMGGHFSFTPGSLNAPTGASFDARVPTFDLVDPRFIY
ncbi:unnamed protein product [Scytosiphon promiscuus]